IRLSHVVVPRHERSAATNEEERCCCGSDGTLVIFCILIVFLPQRGFAAEKCSAGNPFRWPTGFGGSVCREANCGVPSRSDPMCSPRKIFISPGLPMSNNSHGVSLKKTDTTLKDG